MTRYYIICNKTLAKGVIDGEVKEKEFCLVDSAFRYQNNSWVEMDRNEINDRLVGYDPTEDGCYAMWNMDIMEQIQTISEEEAKVYMEQLN